MVHLACLQRWYLAKPVDECTVCGVKYKPDVLKRLRGAAASASAASLDVETPPQAFEPVDLEQEERMRRAAWRCRLLWHLCALLALAAVILIATLVLY